MLRDEPGSDESRPYTVSLSLARLVHFRNHRTHPLTCLVERTVVLLLISLLPFCAKLVEKKRVLAQSLNRFDHVVQKLQSPRLALIRRFAETLPLVSVSVGVHI